MLIGYITGFFAQTIAPIVNMSEVEILLIFGGTTALYTMFGGLMGVVVTEVVHFVVLMVGSVNFMFIAVAQHGGWNEVLQRISATRPEALNALPPVYAGSAANSIEMTTIVLLVLQGFFFAGSPTAAKVSRLSDLWPRAVKLMRLAVSCSTAFLRYPFEYCH